MSSPVRTSRPLRVEVVPSTEAVDLAAWCAEYVAWVRDTEQARQAPAREAA